MDMEAIEQLMVAKHEGNTDRIDYRNDHKKRKLKTVHGQLILDRPDIRAG